MAQYAPLRDAFNDFTKLLIDKQEWDARREKENQRDTRDNMILQSQLEDAALRRESMKRQAARDREAMREVEVNIFDVVPNNEYSHRKIFESPDASIKFARLMGGSQVDQATGRVLDDNGNSVRLAKGIASDRMVQAFAAISPLFDPEEMIGENITAINGKLSSLESELRKVPQTDVAKRKQLMERISEAKTLQTQHTGMLSPDKLLPWYKQRQSHVEGLLATVASGGGDPEVMRALQASASRMQQDYLQVQQRVMQAEQNKVTLQARREDKATDAQTQIKIKQMEIDSRKAIAEAKAEGTAGGKYSEHIAYLTDTDGTIIPSTGRVVKVPKNSPGSFTPEEADPNLKGYVWQTVDKDVNANEKRVKLDAKGAESILKGGFELEDSKSMTGPIIPDANRPRLTAAEGFLGEFLKNSPDEATAAWKAKTMVLNAELAFVENLKAALAASDIKDPEEVKVFAEIMATSRTKNSAGKEDPSFFETFKYVPKLEHESSLRKLLGR